MSQSVPISTPVPRPRLLSELPAQVHAQEAREVLVLPRDHRIAGARRERGDRPVVEEQSLVGDVQGKPPLAGETVADLHRGPIGIGETWPDMGRRYRVAIVIGPDPVAVSVAAAAGVGEGIRVGLHALIAL